MADAHLTSQVGPIACAASGTCKSLPDPTSDNCCAGRPVPGRRIELGLSLDGAAAKPVAVWAGWFATSHSLPAAGCKAVATGQQLS